MTNKKKILYFDMDNVLVDFQSGIDQLSEETLKEYEGCLDEVPGIFSLMQPIDGAVEAVKLLSQYFDCYILSTAPWKNISAWSDKVAWAHKHFGDEKESLFYKRLIISHHKNLNSGDFLIDDRTKNGAGKFGGELILFGSDRFPNWQSVVQYLMRHNRDIQTIYQETITFVAERHGEQKIPGSNISYMVHLSNVCMEILLAAAHTEEFNLPLAVQVALLHDVLEDTNTTEEDLKLYFGDLVTFCVQALTKPDDMPKDKKMQYSLHQIKQCSKEVWAVKLADRITNLQPPPIHWAPEKIDAYREEAKLIYEELKDGNAYLANRLKEAIENYAKMGTLHSTAQNI